MKTWVGVDVSKATLDICWESEGKPNFLKVSNDAKGFALLQASLPPHCHVVMEATGVYYLIFAKFLTDAEIPVSVINPLSTKRFSQMQLSKVKTDKADAQSIARYAATQNPPLWKFPEPIFLEMKQLSALLDLLDQQRRAALNQVEAISHSPFPSKEGLCALGNHVRNLDKQLAEIEAHLDNMVKEHYAKEEAILCSIPGFGKKTARILLIATQGFRDTKNGRSLSAYIGISPRVFQSGTSVRGRGRITKMGNRRVRSIVYMCTLSAIRFNKSCNAFYMRLKAAGKPPKVALVAVAGKLLRQAVAMVKNGQLFDEKLAMGLDMQHSS